MVIDLLSLKNGLLEHVASRTDAYISAMPKEIRKAYGQFFTSKEAASFMASLFVVPEQEREKRGCGNIGQPPVCLQRGKHLIGR